jgi:triosephosphate isomerase
VVQGEGSLSLAKSAEVVARRTGVEIAVAPPMQTLFYVARRVRVPVLSQHADAVNDEASTGRIPSWSLSLNGVAGSILNHSERPMPVDQVEVCVLELRKYGLLSLVCAARQSDLRSLAEIGPDCIALEPPELIGSGRAVSRVAAEAVREGVREVKSINRRVTVLCGAGISSAEDVTAALELGAEGVLVSSSVVKAVDQRAKLSEFANAALRWTRGGREAHVSR